MVGWGGKVSGGVGWEGEWWGGVGREGEWWGGKVSGGWGGKGR